MIRFPPLVGPVFEMATFCVDVVLICTVPKLNGEGVAVKNGDAIVFDVMKSALTVSEPLTVTVQVVAVPLHAPDHPLNEYPDAGTTVRVTEVPWLKLEAHMLGQRMPAGLLAIVPPVKDPDKVMYKG
jgi:hypothetical protein